MTDKVEYNDLFSDYDDILSKSAVPQKRKKDISLNTPLPTNYSISDLEKDDEFNKRAERFMAGIGRNENIFEYLRDADYSLTAAAQRSIEIGDWTNEEKQDYAYLYNKFSNAKLKGVKERLEFAKDFAIDTIADPMNLLALVFAPMTGGMSLAARTTAGKLAQEGFKKLAASQLTKQQIQQTGRRAAAKKAFKRPAILTGAEGASWGGLHDYFNQSNEVQVGLKEDIDFGRTALSSVLGGGLGAGIGGAFGAVSGAKFFDKMFTLSNEAEINKHIRSLKPKDIETAWDIDNTFDTATPRRSKEYLDKAVGLLFGKTTTEFLEKAKSSQTLRNVLRKFRYDYDGTSALSKDSYGEAKTKMWGFYTSRFERAYNRIGLVKGKKLSENDNRALRTRILNPKEEEFIAVDGSTQKISDVIKESAKEINELNEQIFKEGLEAGLFSPDRKVKNYLPRLFKYSLVEKNRGKLEQLLIKYNHANPMNDFPKTRIIAEIDGKTTKIEGIEENALATDMKIFGRNFLEEANGNETKAKQLKAKAIVDNMLESKHTPFEFIGNPNAGGGQSFLQTRVLGNIPDEELGDLIETDIGKIMRNYYTSAAQTITRTNFFGRTLADFENNYLVKIKQELMDSGLEENDVNNAISKLKETHKTVTGLTPSTIADKYLRYGSSWARLIQQMAHLPLATLSSITEPIILLQRAGLKDSPEIITDMGKALGKNFKRELDKGISAIRRGLGGKTVLKDLEDDEWLELYEVGLALEQATMDRLEGLTGEALATDWSKGLQNKFFKVNLLDQWTRTVQLASFTTGKRLIQKNSQQLFEHTTGATKLNDTKVKYLQEQLQELGVNPNEAVRWYRNSLDSETLQFDLNKALKQDFYKNVTSGANRFVKEVILNPSTAEANRPLWFSSPAGQILMQFAGYPTVFSNTVLKRFVKEIAGKGDVKQVLYTSPKTIGTVLTMTAVAVYGDYIRSRGKSFEDKTDGEIIASAVRRWGGFGPLDYGSRFSDELDRNNNLLVTSLKSVGGPLLQDVVEQARYGTFPVGLIGKNAPGRAAYTLAFGKDFNKNLDKAARELDMELLELLRGEEEKTPFSKGGLVEGPDVPNTKEDPAEAINPATGEPYTAGTFLEEDEDV